MKDVLKQINIHQVRYNKYDKMMLCLSVADYRCFVVCVVFFVVIIIIYVFCDILIEKYYFMMNL